MPLQTQNGEEDTCGRPNQSRQDSNRIGQSQHRIFPFWTLSGDIRIVDTPPPHFRIRLCTANNSYPHILPGTNIGPKWGRIPSSKNRACCNRKLNVKKIVVGRMEILIILIFTFALARQSVAEMPVQTFFAMPTGGVAQAFETLTGLVIAPIWGVNVAISVAVAGFTKFPYF